MSDNPVAEPPLDLTDKMLVRDANAGVAALPQGAPLDRPLGATFQPAVATALASPPPSQLPAGKSVERMSTLMAMRLGSQMSALMFDRQIVPEDVASALNVPISTIHSVLIGDIQNMTVGMLARLLSHLDARLNLSMLVPTRPPQPPQG